MDKLLTLVVIGMFGVIAGAVGVIVMQPSMQYDRGPLGAISSPDFDSQYFSFGGVRHWAGHMEPRAASSTVCSIQSPAATTTLVAATAQLTSTAAYATDWELGWALTSQATTTRLAHWTIAASVQGEVVATSTGFTTLTNTLVRPNSYINLKVATGSVSALFSPSGVCSAVFREL